MRDVTIRDYIGNAKELTAEEVRRLPTGTKVIIHSFDRWTAHQTLEVTIVQRGRQKVLAYYDYYGMLATKRIVKETDRMVRYLLLLWKTICPPLPMLNQR